MASAGLVQCPGQFPVSRPRGIEFLGPLLELAPYVGQVLFEQRDATLQLVDVGGRTKAGFLPCGFTEALGQTLLQLPDPDCQPPVPLQRVGQVCPQRGPADGRDPAFFWWGCCGGVDAFEEVAVPVEVGAVHSCRGGQAGDRDVLVASQQDIEGFERAICEPFCPVRR